MKNKFKIYFYILIFLFGIFSYAQSSLTVSCQGLPNPADVNQTVNFSSSVFGGTGNYTYDWYGACLGSSVNCSRSFSSEGIYTAYLDVYSGQEFQTANCPVTVVSANPCTSRNYKACYGGDVYWYDSCQNRQELYQDCGSGNCSNGQCINQGNRYLSCYNNDVYWFDSLLGRQEKFQDCGDSYCQDMGNYYCSGNNVYVQQTCYVRRCSGAACYSNPSSTSSKLIQACGYNQICQNGQCTGNQECTSGPCCENGRFRPSYATCNYDMQTDYSCAWGTECSSDVAKRARLRYQYCSGTNSQCTGTWGDWSSWTGWEVADYCSAKERCVSGYSQCQASSSCSTTYTKKCYGNSLYWYDNYGVRQSLYRNCSGDNQCTIDSCTNNKCVNELKCDGSTCKKDSQDYCDFCQHVGDGTCNCGETASSTTDCAQTCPTATATGGIVVSILAKKSKETTEWSKSLALASKENFDFLVIVSNQGENTLLNSILKVSLPAEINFKDDLRIDGSSFGADIETGIVLGTLTPKTVKTITFKAVTAAEGETVTGATVSSNGLSAVDYLKLNVEKSGTELATIGSSFSDFLRSNYMLALFLLIGILIVALIIRTAYKSLRNA